MKTIGQKFHEICLFVCPILEKHILILFALTVLPCAITMLLIGRNFEMFLIYQEERLCVMSNFILSFRLFWSMYINFYQALLQ